MATGLPGPKLPVVSEQKLSGIGATEDQVDMRDTLPQRIDRFGTKLEDLAGTGSFEGEGG